MAGMEIITLLRRKPRLRAEAHFDAQARVFSPWGSTVLVACLMIFSAVVQGEYDVETVLRKPLAIVQFTVDWYRKINGL